jgi:hypothetical protein
LKKKLFDESTLFENCSFDTKIFSHYMENIHLNKSDPREGIFVSFIIYKNDPKVLK